MASFSSTESLLALWEIAEYIGTTLVFLGVVGEVVADHGWPRREPSRKRFARYSTWVLVVGLAIETFALMRTNQLSGQLIAKLHSETAKEQERSESFRATAKGFEKDIADANARIAAANERALKSEASIAAAGKLAAAGKADAARANERAAVSEQEAAHLNKIAEEERLARLTIEERLRPRHLSPDQIDAIRGGISLFSGTEIDVSSLGSDPEAAQYAEELAEVLAQSGWKVTRSMYAGSLPSGLILRLRSAHDPAAARLQQVLRLRGIMAPAELFSGSGPAIVLEVGVKP